MKKFKSDVQCTMYNLQVSTLWINFVLFLAEYSEVTRAGMLRRHLSKAGPSEVEPSEIEKMISRVKKEDFTG